MAGLAWPGSPQVLAHERKEGAGLTPSPPAPVDAQHYIEHIESLAQQRKNQVIRLTEENKAFGRKLKQAPQRPKLGEEFGADGTDLPPRTRAMFEDNRMMKDRVKKCKDKVAQNERTITLQQQQVLKLQDKCSSLEASLQACTHSPKDLMDEALFQRQLGERERAIKDLEERLSILTKSKTADLKAHRVNLAQMRKQLAEKDEKIRELEGVIDEKTKEIRAQGVKVGKLKKKIEPMRVNIEELKREEAEKAAAAREAELKLQELMTPVEIVLNVIVTESDALGERKEDVDLTEIAPGEDPELEAAATKIQASFKGHKARKALKEDEERERAAVKIQAVHRGAAARRRSVEMKKEKEAVVKAAEEKELEEAAVKIQATFRGHQTRKELAGGGAAEAAPAEEAAEAKEEEAKVPKKPTLPKGGQPNPARSRGAKK